MVAANAVNMLAGFNGMEVGIYRDGHACGHRGKHSYDNSVDHPPQEDEEAGERGWPGVGKQIGDQR